MILKLKRLFSSLGKPVKELWRRFFEHRIGYTGGQVAYFFILSIFPFLLFINAIIASLRIPEETAISFLRPFLPEQIVSLIAGYVEYVGQESAVSLLSFGIVLALFSASKSVRSLGVAFDLAYETENSHNFIVRTLFSMLYILLFALVLVACIIFVAFGNGFIEALLSELTLPFAFVDLLGLWRWLTMVATLFFILSIVYKFLPTEKVRFSETLPGTALALFGLLSLTTLFSFYVNNIAGALSFYGSFSAIIFFMLWLYFAGIILILGAELNKVVSDMKKNS